MPVSVRLGVLQDCHAGRLEDRSAEQKPAADTERREVAGLVAIVHSEKMLAVAADAHAFGQRYRRQASLLGEPFQDASHQHLVRPAGEIVQRSAPQEHRPAVIRREQHVGFARLGEFAPEFERSAALDRNRYVRAQRFHARDHETPKTFRQVRRQVRGNGEVCCLGSGARPDQNDALMIGKCLPERLAPREKPRNQHQPVIRQLPRRRRDHVDGEAKPAQRTVEIEDQPEIIELAPLRLDFPGPGGRVVEDDRHFRLAGAWQVEGSDFLRNPFRFAKTFRLDTIRPQQPGMHLLLRERHLPPAEIADRLGAVGERLPCPESDHAVTRRRVARPPVHRPRLLFHHPPAAA
jgi:hypothetical protein